MEFSLHPNVYATNVRPYAIHYIGHQGKMYGYVDNTIFEQLLHIKLNA
ncbi:MAG: hypothetical protein AAF639_22270 [Chloroflexota bacterium]